MNSKTFLLAILTTAYGLGFTGVAGAADTQPASSSEAVQQGVSTQTESAHGSGHVAPNQDRTSAVRAGDRTQPVPSNQYSSAQTPVRALNLEIYYPPYTY